MKAIKNMWKKVWAWTKPYLKPRMIPLLIVAWIVTNGWCYAFIAIGSAYDIQWMWVAGTFWASILWLPFTPEKIILTIPLALLLYRIIYKKKFVKKEVI